MDLLWTKSTIVTLFVLFLCSLASYMTDEEIQKGFFYPSI